MVTSFNLKKPSFKAAPARRQVTKRTPATQAGSASSSRENSSASFGAMSPMASGGAGTHDAQAAVEELRKAVASPIKEMPASADDHVSKMLEQAEKIGEATVGASDHGDVAVPLEKKIVEEAPRPSPPSQVPAEADAPIVKEARAAPAAAAAVTVAPSKSGGGLMGIVVPVVAAVALGLVFVLRGRGGAVPLAVAKTTPFFLRELGGNDCFTGTGFEPCNDKKNKPRVFFTLAPQDDYKGKGGGLLMVNKGSKCVVVSEPAKQLGLGACKDAGARGWRLDKNRLTVQGLAITKEGNKAAAAASSKLASSLELYVNETHHTSGFHLLG